MRYLNHAGTSWPKPSEVIEAVNRALTLRPDESAAQAFLDARAAVTDLLNLPSPERLLFTPSCTAALAVAIGDLPWADGDIVLTSGLEHHALLGPIQRLEQTRGVVHLASPYTPGAPMSLEWLKQRLRKGRVRLVATTHASNVTGEIVPVRAVAELAHAHDALVLLDAAQTAGVVPVDVAALGVDMVTFAGHKGPKGPQGIGGLWAAADVLFASPAASCEATGNVEGDGVDDACKPGAMPGYCDVGGTNIAGLAGLAAGIRAQLALETAHWRQPILLGAQLRSALKARPGVRVLAGPGPSTTVVSFLIDGLPLERAEAGFAEHGIVLRAGQHCAPQALNSLGVGGTIRASFGPFSEEADVKAVLRAVDRLK